MGKYCGVMKNLAISKKGESKKGELHEEREKKRVCVNKRVMVDNFGKIG